MFSSDLKMISNSRRQTDTSETEAGGWADGWMGGWMDGWMDRRVSARASARVNPPKRVIQKIWEIGEKDETDEERQGRRREKTN